MTFSLNFLPKHRSNQTHLLLKSVWEVSCWCWSITGGAQSASRQWLRHFLLLKLAMVLLFPHRSVVLLLLGCILSLRALLMLRSPHISTKPSTVFLGQLALCDCLVLLQWTIRLGGTMSWWTEKVDHEALSILCQQLLDAHHLASLLLLGLLGLEATLVSRWPRQTLRFRTSQWAHLSCGLVWVFVLLELVLSLHLILEPRLQKYSESELLLEDVTSPSSSFTAFSFFLRKTLWLMNLWLHYSLFSSKPQRRKSSFH